MSTTDLIEKLSELDKARIEAQEKLDGSKVALEEAVAKVRAEHEEATKSDREHLDAILRDIRTTQQEFAKASGVTGGSTGGGRRSSGSRAPRGSVPNVPDSASDDIVSFLKSNGPAKSKAIRQGIGLDEAIPAAKWSTFLSGLADTGEVKREGQKAGTTYSV